MVSTVLCWLGRRQCRRRQRNAAVCAMRVRNDERYATVVARVLNGPASVLNPASWSFTVVCCPSLHRHWSFQVLRWISADVTRLLLYFIVCCEKYVSLAERSVRLWRLLCYNKCSQSILIARFKGKTDAHRLNVSERVSRGLTSHSTLYRSFRGRLNKEQSPDKFVIFQF